MIVVTLPYDIYAFNKQATWITGGQCAEFKEENKRHIITFKHHQ